MPPPAEGFASRHFLGTAVRTQPDRRLVTLVRDGYEIAFEEIVRRYGRPLTGYAASIVGSHSEDVTQDAFSKAPPDRPRPRRRWEPPELAVRPGAGVALKATGQPCWWRAPSAPARCWTTRRKRVMPGLPRRLRARVRATSAELPRHPARRATTMAQMRVPAPAARPRTVRTTAARASRGTIARTPPAPASAAAIVGATTTVTTIGRAWIRPALIAPVPATVAPATTSRTT